MAYSKAYQTVVAGRTREDEVSFYGKNKVATPSGAKVAYRNSGNKKAPEIIKSENLLTEYAGKARPSGGGSVVTAMGAGSNNWS